MSNYDSISNSQLSPIPNSGEPFHISEETIHGPFRLMTMIRNGRKFIIKGLISEYAFRPEYRELLRKEFDLGVRFSHPYIVSVFSFEHFEIYGDCIVMEYVDGVTLDKFLAEKPRRSVRVRIAGELAEAVNYMHSKGVSHRDLKPDNIMITRDGNHVVIIDFGLGDSQDFVILKRSSATLSYGAPEQLTSNVADMKSDIYSLGLIFKDLRLPFFYRRIISGMLVREPDKRPSIRNVVASIKTVNNWSARLPLLFAALVGVAIIIAFMFYAKSSQEQQTITPDVNIDTVDVPEQSVPSRDTVSSSSVSTPTTPAVSVEKNVNTESKSENDMIEKGTASVVNKIYNEEIRNLENIYHQYDSTYANRGHGKRFMTYDERTKLVYAVADTLKSRLLRAGVDDHSVDNAVSAYWTHVSALSVERINKNNKDNGD